MVNVNKKIFCIDFDGTIVAHRYPEIGEPVPHAIEVLKQLKDAGAILVLWTCREDTRKRKCLTEAVEFCKKNGVEFHGVNELPIDYDFREEGPRRKPYAHYYIDDRNFGGLPGWNEIANYFFGDD